MSSTIQSKSPRYFQLPFADTMQNSVGDPPYDMITNFGKADVKKPAIKCKSSSGVRICTQRDGKKIKAPIYATIAKRRK